MMQIDKWESEPQFEKTIKTKFKKKNPPKKHKEKKNKVNQKHRFLFEKDE